MGLYLCVFDEEKEDDLEGVDVGSYDDFHYFRSMVCEKLENKKWGSRFPILMNHHDSDGTWSVEEAKGLQVELKTIMSESARLPPIPYNSPWQREVARKFGVKNETMYDSFIDVDGEPLLERLAELSSVSEDQNLAILFQ